MRRSFLRWSMLDWQLCHGDRCTVIYLMMIFDGRYLGPIINKFYGSEYHFPTRDAAPGFVFALPMNWLFDRIPGLRDWKADPESIQTFWCLWGLDSYGLSDWFDHRNSRWL